MSMEYLFIYLLQIIECIEVIKIIFYIFTMTLILFYIVLGLSTDFKYEQYNGSSYIEFLDMTTKSVATVSRFCKKWILFCLILCLAFALIPSKQTFLLFGGVYYGKKTYQQISTNKRLEKVKTIIDLELDKMIKDLSNDN